MTVSHSNVSISPGMGTGRRRPEESGGPSSIFWQTRAFTPPLSSVTISVGPLQPVERDALFLRVAKLFDAGGSLRLRAAVDAADQLGSEALGNAQAVHRRVARADDDDAAAERDGRVLVGEVVASHEVHARQEFVRAVDLPGELARDAEKSRGARPGPDEDGVEAALGE